MTVKAISRRMMLAGAAGLWALAHAPAAKAGALDNFSLSPEKPPVPDVNFKDEDGRIHALSDYRGRIVLLNAWATWCGPCVSEMPGLNGVQRKLGGESFQVLPISMDRGGPLTVDLFMREHALRHLPILLDYRGQISTKLRPLGLPFTVLIDRDGYEIGRGLGEVQWDTEEGLSLLKAYIEV